MTAEYPIAENAPVKTERFGLSLRTDKVISSPYTRIAGEISA